MNPAELRMMWMSSQYNSERISLEDAATLLGHSTVGLSVMEDMTHQPTLVSYPHSNLVYTLLCIPVYIVTFSLLCFANLRLNKPKFYRFIFTWELAMYLCILYTYFLICLNGDFFEFVK